MLKRFRMTQLAPEEAFSGLSPNLRTELIAEYRDVQSAFFAGRWRECGLAAGRFCEVAFTVVNDIADGTASNSTSKPKDFVSACRKLESDTRLPDGLRLHATKLLPVLYDIRNRRDIGHVNGDVDPSLMDANLCLMGSSWILAELVRALHNLPTTTAQQLVSSIVEVKTPCVWDGGDIRRLAINGLPRADELMILVSSNQGITSEDDLLLWMGIKQKSNLRKILNPLHDKRMIEAKSNYMNIRLLPLGVQRVQSLLKKHT